MRTRLRDNANGYGAVTLALHWGMALLFAWQFLVMALVRAFGKGPIIDVLTATHAPTGTLLFALAVLRLTWLALNAYRRPLLTPSGFNIVAMTMHTALYVFMIGVPAIAVLWAYGSGNAFSVFGVNLWSAGRPETEWLVAAGKALHAPLAWTFLSVIATHVLAGLLRQYSLARSNEARKEGGSIPNPAA